MICQTGAQGVSMVEIERCRKIMSTNPQFFLIRHLTTRAFVISRPGAAWALAGIVMCCGLAFRSAAQDGTNEPPQGYYRYPAIHGDTIVFTAEGDLWSVNGRGGLARRLTSHPGTESHGAF